MPTKSVAIIGAGMGGLAAGVYGQLNGYQTDIFEMHSRPGGQCASWTRQGYTFDACIHHLFGCNDTSAIYQLWHELGAMPRRLVATEECVAVASPEGTVFRDYYDPDLLEEHLLQFAPADTAVIHDYANATRAVAKADFMGAAMMGATGSLLGMTPRLLPTLKWFKATMAALGERFTDPFLRAAFPLLVYSMPETPAIVHLARHGYGMNGALQWPLGGAATLAASIASRYKELGGQVHYRQRVTGILVENDRAAGVKLADGTQHRADMVISNADGRKTIMDLLRGRYTDAAVRGYCAAPVDETPWAVHVFLGVNRDLSAEPSSLVMLLDEPVTIANHTTKSIEMQLYGFDRTMAPGGKGVIKVELVSGYKYWKELSTDRARYEEEKQKVADQTIALLEPQFPGIRQQVEVVDVPTLLTWERYMGGTHGFANMPVKKGGIIGSLLGRGQLTSLPGLGDFRMVGAWATSAGALFANALSGKNAVKAICKADGKRFVTETEA